MIKDTKTISRNIKKAYDDHMYIVCQHAIYQPCYSVAQASYYGMKVYTSQTNLTKKGRFYHMTGTEVNHLIGLELLNNL